MNDAIKKKIVLFYIGGILNAMFGLYVVFEGPNLLPPDQVRILSLAFLAFTAINFLMATYLKRKVQAAAAAQAQNDDRSPAS